MLRHAIHSMMVLRPNAVKVVVGVVLLVIDVSAVFSQAQVETPASEDPDASVLSGPNVRDRSAESLVSTTMEGRFNRLNVRPEQAAIEKLALDTAQRERARQVLEERSEAMRRLLLDNLDRIEVSEELLKPNDQSAVRKLASELYAERDESGGLLRDPLLEPLAGAIGKDLEVQLKAMVDEYWEAVIEEELRSASKGKTREQATQRLMIESFRREVVSAYDATFRPLQRKLDNIVTTVAATPEQRVLIRSAMIAQVREARFMPNPEQKASLARAIHDVLDESQRLKLIESALATM